MFGFRVVVGSDEDCYRALGVLHRTWQMVPERFKDFISLPKSNGYRSIHTTVIGPGEPARRSADPHPGNARRRRARRRRPLALSREAWTTTIRARSSAYEWLRDMVDLLERGDSPEEFYEHSKLNLYQDQVFCFTPKGMLISLPRGATPIDFAYFVHTDVGNTAVGAKVNGVHTPLHTPLKNGDQVEIICSKEQTPSPLWEQFVVTGRARAEIRRYLRHAQRDQHVALGRKILEKVFADEGIELTDKAVEGVLKKLRLAKAEDVYADVGRGALRADEVLQAVYPRAQARSQAQAPELYRAEFQGRLHRGLTEGIGYRLGGCCHPIPGDRIIGLMVPGEGVVIHTIDCEVLDRHQDSMADWIDVRWKDHVRRALGRAHHGAAEERAGRARHARQCHRPERRQHLQPEDHQPQSALFRVPGRCRSARRRASGESIRRAEGGFGGRSGRARARARHRQSGRNTPLESAQGMLPFERAKH